MQQSNCIRIKSQQRQQHTKPTISNLHNKESTAQHNYKPQAYTKAPAKHPIKSTPANREPKKCNLKTKLQDRKQQHKVTSEINNCKWFPSSIPIKDDAGKFGLMWPRGQVAMSHPAANLLHEYSTIGCPVDTGKDWTHEQIVAALKRGSHVSARTPDALKCLHQEINEKLKGNYLLKVKWGSIKNSYPKHFKLSPLAMIPHKSRSYRCILDLSFQLKVNGKKINSVNLGTSIKAPQKSMAQLGVVIRRIIFTMYKYYNLARPFMFSKCDICTL